MMSFSFKMTIIWSPLTWFLYSVVFSAFLAAYLGKSYFVICIILLLVCFKSIAFEVLLFRHYLDHKKGKWDWFNEITPNIILGGIPLDSLNHFKILTKVHQVSGVISINQNHELLAHTMFGDPIRPAQWKSIGVHHLHLESPDFKPPSLDLLHKGADFIDHHVKGNRIVYVHCKSGIGRSAAIVIAYLTKYNGMTAVGARTFVAQKRRIIFGTNSKNAKNMELFEESLKR
jgi:protein-tyrosine phosphatase